MRGGTDDDASLERGVGGDDSAEIVETVIYCNYARQQSPGRGERGAYSLLGATGAGTEKLRRFESRFRSLRIWTRETRNDESLSPLALLLSSLVVLL